jgi:phosphonate transport system substrate-binding protein
VTVVLLLALAAGVYFVNQATLPEPRNEKMLLLTGLGRAVRNRLHERYTDVNKDLVADPPAIPTELSDPDVIRFCYVAAEGEKSPAPKWKHFMDHLAKKTGKRVEYLHLKSTMEQLIALKSGRLHVTGLNTGNVPIAVNAAGFVPVCSPGSKDGESTYKMQIIVPTSSLMKGPLDLKGKTLVLTHPRSNSGYRAPLVILRSDFGLEPGSDYDFDFSRSHANSIKGVAEGRYEAAAIASDLLRAAIAKGEVQRDKVRVIYESEPFPQASIGHVHNLRPELAKAIKEALLSYTWQKTPLAAEFAADGATQFVAVSYKDDWALVRRIDDAIGFRHEIQEKN